MKFGFILLLVILAILNAGCFSPELVQALAKDEASFCGHSDIRGGAGAVAGMPMGGYGQVTTNFCRSNKDDALITLSPDGTISIQNGQKPKE